MLQKFTSLDHCLCKLRCELLPAAIAKCKMSGIPRPRNFSFRPTTTEPVPSIQKR